jgi:uncharacterized membrane protein HdeD (DUF308 family)
MDEQQKPTHGNSATVDRQTLGRWWFVFVLLGIVLMGIGAAAVGTAFATTIAAMLIFGIILVCGGVIQLVSAFIARTWNAFLLHAMVGVLHLVVGALMIEHPVVAAAGLTLMLATLFLVGGIIRVTYALTQSFSGRYWVLANGALSLVLGVLIWRHWPDSSLWVIGLFVGIDLLVNGWSWVMVGLSVKPKDEGVGGGAAESTGAVASAVH